MTSEALVSSAGGCAGAARVCACVCRSWPELEAQVLLRCRPDTLAGESRHARVGAARFWRSRLLHPVFRQFLDRWRRPCGARRIIAALVLTICHPGCVTIAMSARADCRRHHHDLARRRRARRPPRFCNPILAHGIRMIYRAAGARRAPSRGRPSADCGVCRERVNGASCEFPRAADPYSLTAPGSYFRRRRIIVRTLDKRRRRRSDAHASTAGEIFTDHMLCAQLDIFKTNQN